MRLGQCTWRNAGGRCPCGAELLRELPHRERLKMYPVCHCHAEPVGFEAGQGGTEVTAGSWIDLHVALLIGEAEQLTRQAAED